jgi:SAM-dependent methyltransferase
MAMPEPTPLSPKYGLHAQRYRDFRPGYPDWVFDKAVAACGEPRNLALELGAGSGQATRSILPRFARTVAVEPDADMAGLIPPDPRLQIMVAPAETAPLPQGVDAAFSATAFHWMDAAVAGRRVAEALRPGGVFLAFGYQPFEIEGPEPVRELFEAEWEVWRPLIHERLTGWVPYEELMARSGAFSRIEPLRFRFDEQRRPEAAAGLLLTTSYAAEHGRRLGDEQAYCDDLTRRVREAASGEPVTVKFEVTGALASV